MQDALFLRWALHPSKHTDLIPRWRYHNFIQFPIKTVDSLSFLGFFSDPTSFEVLQNKLFKSKKLKNPMIFLLS